MVKKPPQSRQCALVHKTNLCTYDLYSPVRMLLMRANPLLGQVGGGWALEIESFLGPVKWHRADRRVPFGAQKICNVSARIKNITHGAL